MSVGTFFSDIAGYAKSTMLSRASDRTGGNANVINSKLSAWVSATAYCDGGLTIVSNNPNWDYGTSTSNASVGLDTAGNAVSPMGGDEDQGYRPRPIITGIEVDEQNSNDGGQNFSRQATLTIRCFSLGQMQAVAYYFLEPGFTIFLQWGWNEPGVNMLGGTSGPSPTVAASMAEFSSVNTHRSNNAGKKDVYLGFITGGDISFKEDYWDITVKSRGFLELPGFLMAADNQKKITTAATTYEPQEYSGNQISSATDINTRRWMQGYNLLPSNKRTLRIKDMLNEAVVYLIRDRGAWINVDESVRINVNASTKSSPSLIARLFGGGAPPSATFGSVEAELESDTEIVGEQKYVRLGTLLEIMNHHDVIAYTFVNGKKIPTRISWEWAICGGFDRMFSTDGGKLFIPNARAPLPDFEKIVEQGGTQTGIVGGAVWNCSVENASGIYIQFPQRKAYSGPPMDSKSIAIPGADSINLDSGTWGYVGDLYVNLDYAKSIFETKGLSYKDAVYQLLNGLSSAAGSMWDFQLQELPVSGNGVAEIRIVDANLVYATKQPNREFVLSGNKSIFFDADLKLDITQELANKIIGQRLGAKFNSSMPPVRSKFFGINKKDQVLTAMEFRTDPGPDTAGSGTPPSGDEAKKIAKADFLKFIKKCTLAPRVEFDHTFVFGKKVVDNCYLCAYDDQALFESLKTGRDNAIEGKSTNASVLLDTHITVNVHGVSGIKRGDKLKIDGLPTEFVDNGFFQITGVKQLLRDDYWTTEITGTFRAMHGG